MSSQGEEDNNYSYVKKKTIDEDSQDSDEGEDLIKPSKNKAGIYSDDDDDDEDDEGVDEITEEDRRFIVDDEDDEEDGDDAKDEQSGDSDDDANRGKKKRRRRRRSEDEDDDLDEDDLDLIQDNLGIRTEKKLKKLRKKGEDDEADRRPAKKVTLDSMFAEDEQGDQVAFKGEELDEVDELDDFIVTETDDSDAGETIRRKKQRVRKNLKAQEQIMKQYGISEAAQDDIEAIFGNGTEYLWVLKLKNIHYEDTEVFIPEGGLMQLQEQKPVKLTDLYEPSEIQAKMLTEEDESIRTTDIPERYQSKELRTRSNEDELKKESLYIAKIMLEEYQKTGRSVNEKLFITAIQQVLQFIHVKSYEVPFIYAHRKDFLARQLDRNDVWRVFDLDNQYLTLKKRMDNLKSQYEELVTGLEEEGIAGIQKDPFIEKHWNSLVSLSNERMNDLQNYMQFHYGEKLAVFDAKKKRAFKRTKRKTPYGAGIKGGLGDFVKIFDINGGQYTKSLLTRSQSHFPEENSSSTPEVVARQFTNSSFSTAEAVLEAARHMIAFQIASIPDLRNFLRNVYIADAVISVRPTDKGRLDIDEQHPYYTFKYLKDKEVKDFKDGQFLQILAAENEGLVEVEIRVDAEDKLLEDALTFIVNDHSNENARKWNEERRKIAELAMKQYLFPLTAKFMREKISVDAIEFVVLQCQIEMMRKIDVAPWKSKNKDMEENELESEDDDVKPAGFKSMAISWGDGGRNTPAVGVVIDETGEFVDFVKLDQLQDFRSESHEGEPQSLFDFITVHRPNVVMVAGWSVTIRTKLFEGVNKVVNEINQNSMGWGGPRDDEEASPIECFIVEDDLARLYMNSKQALKDFPSTTYPSLVPYCVSLCRRLQDPVSEFASYCSDIENCKFLRLNPLQNLIPEERLYQIVERSFMNVVSTCGIDINLAVHHKHRASTLKYISGLGPRKAQAFLSKIASFSNGGRLELRQDLILKALCGPTVYTNCASFIRIRRYHFVKHGRARDEHWDILDDTRVHPEDYTLARKMALDALDLDEYDAALDEDENPSQHVRDLMMSSKTDALNDLELGAFAHELQKTQNIPKIICLNEIKDELMRPYQERRKIFEPPSADAIFYMLTNETPDTLRENMLLSNCPVVKLFDKFVIVALPSASLEGRIHIKFLSDGMISSCSEVARVGELLNCCVLKVDKERFLVDLSARIRDVNDALDLQNHRSKKDPRFSDEWEQMDLSRSRKPERKATKKKIALHHPFFKSIDYREAENQLKDMPNGEVIVRPSTKGPDHVSITWKVGPGVYQHVDMKEVNGIDHKMYEVDGKTYSELDEYLELVINPLARYVQDVMKGPKYMNFSLEEMGNWVSQHCKLTRRSAYGFILCRERPGRFYMVYRHPQNQLKNEYVNVISDGYLYRNKKFRNIEEVVMYFKKDEQRKAERAARGDYGRSGSSRR